MAKADDQIHRKEGLKKEGALGEAKKDFIHSPAKQKRFLNTVAQISSLAWTIAAMLVIGFFAGQWLDKRFGVSPLFVVILSLASVVAVMRFIYQFSKRL